jgi:phospholipase/carboxylesterase
MHRTSPHTRRTLGPAPQPDVQLQSALFTPAGPGTTFSLFAPVHYEAGYDYPLVVWLHGEDDDERQLLRVMPDVSMRNYVAVAPRAGGRGWAFTAAGLSEAEQHVFDCIEAAAAKYHVARHRVFLAGFGGGGTMAFHLGLRQPERFAGVVSLCGPFPSGSARWADLAAIRRLPMLMAVGRHSRRYPAEDLCEHLRLFHAAGMSVTLRQYPFGHELAARMLRDVDRWIMERITSGPDPADS